MATPKQIDLLIGSILIQRVRLHNVTSLLHVYRLILMFLFMCYTIFFTSRNYCNNLYSTEKKKKKTFQDRFGSKQIC